MKQVIGDKIMYYYKVNLWKLKNIDLLYRQIQLVISRYNCQYKNYYCQIRLDYVNDDFVLNRFTLLIEFKQKN